MSVTTLSHCFLVRLSGHFQFLRWTSILLGAVFTLLALSPVATAASPPRCWVEFRFSPPAAKLQRSGLKLPPAYENMEYYSVITNPDAPHYWAGFADGKYTVFLFDASCAHSQDSIDAFTRSYKGRTKPPLMTNIIIRAPTPADMRRLKILWGRPNKFMLECTVVIDTVREAPVRYSPDRGVLAFLLPYLRARNLWDPVFYTSLGRDRSQRYLMFLHSCDRRFEFANKFIAAYHKFAPDGARYKVLHTEVRSRSGIELQPGSPWLDHYFPKGRRTK